MKLLLIITFTLALTAGAFGQTYTIGGDPYIAPSPIELKNFQTTAYPGRTFKDKAEFDALILQERFEPISKQKELAKNDPPKPAPKAEEKSKAPAPIILDKTKLLELTNLRLALENAQLKATAAIPVELKKAIEDSSTALGKFWQAVGVNPEELATKWKASDGLDGAIILTPVVPDKKEVAPAPKPQ